MKLREWVFCRGAVLRLAAVMGIAAAEADASVTPDSGEFVLDGEFASDYGPLVSGHGRASMRQRARKMGRRRARDVVGPRYDAVAAAAGRVT